MRPPSPTNTTYSGISNYKSEAYRPLLSASPMSGSGGDARAVAQAHFDELHRYLASYLAKEPANSRSTARQKLTRLTRQQFQELSTDVFDELIRRKTNTTENEVPFLPVRDDFHPKRNQARQKLATLPTGRFKDLSSDVYYELGRRYPEFKEEALPTNALASPGSTYDDAPAPEFNSPYASAGMRRVSEDRAADSGYGASSPVPVRKSIDEYAPRRSQDDYFPRRGEENYGMDAYGSRRRPSQDTTGRRSEDRERDLGRRPSQSVSVHSDSTSTTNAQSATAGMVIPNKSTIAEEEIEVPYGREVRDSTGTAVDDRERSRDRGRETDTDAEDDFRNPAGGLGGLSGLTARLQAEDDEEEGALTGNRSAEDYYDKLSYGRASVTSDRSAGARGGRASVPGEDGERIRRDYEFKVATMQSRITGLERDLEDAQMREQKWGESEARVRMMEEELEQLRTRAEEKTAAMLALQTELDQLREDHARERDLAARRARQDEEELQILRDRCERLEAGGGGGDVDPEILDQLRSDMEGLMTELADLSRRNDELITAKDSDLIVIRDLDAQLKEYKRKYEQSKTELRSVKATSQLFLQPPKTDDQLPVSPDGGLLDIHVTAFVSAIDSLLTAARSSSPTRVLTPMKSVVNSVTAVVEDVRAFERRPARDRAEIDIESLHSLRERAEATLSNLVAAAKTHATSAGMSPVSLLDAAASHVSLTVTEIGKTICIRRASKAEQERFMPASPPATAASSVTFSPTLRSIDETRSAHKRAGSNSSARSTSDRLAELASSPRSVLGRMTFEDQRRPASNMSSSSASSPPPVFDGRTTSSANVTSDESAPTEGPEDAWSELKPYLEAQTESIVLAIQSVLSAVRSPTPSPALSENLTQIITIVTSIVAVCKDNIPPASAAQGEDILRELSDHANRLSEVQALPEVTKESRQVMAKSSFAIANAMKGLMKL
ncbi:hypothetical protein PHLGIDRAFT_31670 [Phlebiopsis gigantea 11061_1 CR5-6]|uniref:GIT Spa2 homology (SHD) domain-containing protein n=1 Tax=Phlebiopsis gigantea (strain 11061_1 CR5-6) TaxID=745531 RepID=A0A0C3NG40_PHLG1|nr:hypothetical protein PHLGIDRAFT_31670 [Phlebiopsis gigantea 11061_1 CR5-6]